MPAPGTPSAPTITDIKGHWSNGYSCKSAAPSPSDTTSLSLELSLAGVGSWSSYGGAAPGGTVTATGLSANTDYDARWVATGSGGSTTGPSTAFTSAPELPDICAFDNADITLTEVTAHSQATLPGGALSFLLRVSDFNVPPFVGNAGAGADTDATVGGLTAGDSYWARWISVGATGEAEGMPRNFEAKVDLPKPPMSSITLNSAATSAPSPFPNGVVASVLILQISVAIPVNWTVVMDNPTAGQNITIVGLFPGQDYLLRWWHGLPGSTITEGPASPFKTLPPGPNGVPCCGDPGGTTGDTDGNLTVGAGTGGETEGTDGDGYPYPYCPYGQAVEECRQCKPCIGSGGGLMTY